MPWSPSHKCFRESSHQVRIIVYSVLNQQFTSRQFTGGGWVRLQMRDPSEEIANTHNVHTLFRKTNIYKIHPFYENKRFVPVKNIITHLATHRRQHTLDAHCKSSLDSKFLEPSTLTTMVYSHGVQTIPMLYLYKNTNSYTQ